MLKDSGTLSCEVGVHERILATAVPEVQDEVAEKADVILFNIDCSTESRSKGSRIVRTVTDQMKLESHERSTHNMRERMEVLPLPEAPMRRT